MLTNAPPAHRCAVVKTLDDWERLIDDHLQVEVV
jgi:hypothetical protein